MEFDAEKFYLGKLCPQRHDYEGTGKSLLRKSHHCLECVRIGVRKAHQNSASFDTWAHRLVTDDQPQRDPDGKLSVACAYCGRRFRPNLRTIISRVRALEGRMRGESRFYCGDACKEACPIYHRQINFKGQKGTAGTSRETSAWLRQEAFKRDNWTCQKCGAGVKSTLEAHHIKPYAEFPTEVLDLPNLITLCKNCHNEIHHLPGCGYAEIGRCK